MVFSRDKNPKSHLQGTIYILFLKSSFNQIFFSGCFIIKIQMKLKAIILGHFKTLKIIQCFLAVKRTCVKINLLVCPLDKYLSLCFSLCGVVGQKPRTICWNISNTIYDKKYRSRLCLIYQRVGGTGLTILNQTKSFDTL